MTHDQTLAQVIAQLERGLPGDSQAGFLGVDLDPQRAQLLLLPVPWEATTSYGGGTARGPEAIRAASHQLDVEDGAFDRPYRAGISLLPADPAIAELNASARGRRRSGPWRPWSGGARPRKTWRASMPPPRR
jgi:agmatinase